LQILVVDKSGSSNIILPISKYNGKYLNKDLAQSQ